MHSPQAPLPARPAAPTTEQRYLFGAPVVDYLCSDAYAEVVKRPPPVQNAFMFAAEATQACVFPFQG
jgi:hypothetical protein